MFKMKKNIEEREETNEAQMGKGHAAAWPSSRGKQKITLCKKPDKFVLSDVSLWQESKEFKCFIFLFLDALSLSPFLNTIFWGYPKGEPFVSVKLHRPQDPTVHKLLY